MPQYKLTKWQVFLRSLLLFFVLEVILFAGILYFWPMTTGQVVGLSILAVIMLIIFSIKTWNNPALDD